MQPRSAELDLPGVTPSRQKRSRETTAALLQAGAELLRTHSLAELSIEALCRQVGATVGAFYSRFESKDAYFNALIELAARDGESMLAHVSGGELRVETGLAERCQLLVAGIVGWIRQPRGRAARRAPARRHPPRSMDHLQVPRPRHHRPRHAPAAPGHGQRPGRRPRPAAIAIGFQVVLGTLVNAILNDPGPLSIQDREMEVRLGNCLLLLLQAEMTPPATQVLRASASGEYARTSLLPRHRPRPIFAQTPLLPCLPRPGPNE